MENQDPNSDWIDISAYRGGIAFWHAPTDFVLAHSIYTTDPTWRLSRYDPTCRHLTVLGVFESIDPPFAQAEAKLAPLLPPAPVLEPVAEPVDDLAFGTMETVEDAIPLDPEPVSLEPDPEPEPELVAGIEEPGSDPPVRKKGKKL